MAKSRQRKESEVADFVEGFKEAKATVFADLSSLKVVNASAFRRSAKKEAVSISTAKKTLLRRALKDAGIDQVDVDAMKGSVSMLFGTGDEIAPAKLLDLLRKDNEKVQVLGGLLEGKWMTADQVKALAKLPSKEQLIAQVVGTIRAPLSGLVNVLAGNTRSLVNVLNAIKDAKSA
jgi:large subunit ribosomal protein L10